MLRKFYKYSFEKFTEPFNFKKRVKFMASEEMDQMIIEYMRNEFGFLVG